MSVTLRASDPHGTFSRRIYMQALEEIGDGIWDLIFYHVLLGRIDQ